MASIHWSVFIIIGAFIGTSSYFMEMTVFIVIGIIFFAYGLLKFIAHHLRGRHHHKVKVSKPFHSQQHAQQHTQHQQQMYQKHYQQSPKKGLIKSCPRCKTHMAPHHKFCGSCGLKM